VSAEIEIVGGAGEYEAAAIAAAIHAILAEEEARARRLSTTSRWKLQLEGFSPGQCGLSHPAGAADADAPD